LVHLAHVYDPHTCMKYIESWKNPRIVIAGLASVAICGYLVFRLLPGPSVAALGERTTACMVSGNANCVFDSILERERTALSLTPAKVHALLQDYILPSYGDLNGAPTKHQLDITDQGQVQLAWSWPKSKGGTIMFATTAVATPEGARTICTTQWMIYHAMEARYQTSPTEERLLVYLRGLERDSAYLTQLGIPGIYDPNNDQVVEWRDVISKMRSEARELGWLKAG